MHMDSRVNAEVDADRILELIYKDSYGTTRNSPTVSVPLSQLNTSGWANRYIQRTSHVQRRVCSLGWPGYRGRAEETRCLRRTEQTTGKGNVSNNFLSAKL
jgi:hypothetical protein